MKYEEEEDASLARDNEQLTSILVLTEALLHKGVLIKADLDAAREEITRAVVMDPAE